MPAAGSGHVPIQQNADDLLPTIVSLHKLTFYYWEQDRFANLLPLLTTWIADPTSNAYTQIALRVAAGLIAPVFFAAIVFRRPADIWRAALAADCLLLLTANAFLLRETFIAASPYGTPLACAGLGMLALRRTGGLSTLLGALGLLAAYTVNIALTIVALPLLMLMAVLRPSDERMRLLLLHLLAAFVAGLMPTAFAAPYPTAFGWHPSLAALAWSLSLVVAILNWMVPAVIGLPIFAALAAGRHRAVRPPGGVFRVSIEAMAVTSILGSLAIASSDHVRLNAFGPRYYIPILLMLLSGAGIAVWQTCRLTVRPPALRHAGFVLVAMLMLVGAKARLTALGAMNQEIVEPAWADLANAVSVRTVAARADAIVGDYWHVWPAVFAAEQLRHDGDGSAPPVLGIAPGAVHRGRVERGAFLARLHGHGEVRLVCIDLPPDACIKGTAVALDIPELHAGTVPAEETLAGPHTLRILTVLPP